MAKILVDVNVILDAVLNGDDISKKVLDKLAESPNELFITASKEAIAQYRDKIVGIIPVHLYGQPANVVEDCAQSLGTKWDGKRGDAFGNAGCF